MRKLLIGLALIGLPLAIANPAWSQTTAPRSDSQPTLVVSGQGEVMAAPDRAIVRLGAEAQANDAAAAQSQVNAIMQRALQQIRAVGIEERKIQTTGLQLFPVYERQRSGIETPPRVVAYRASNMVQVEVENLQLIGKVIDAGVAAGANRQEGISFELRNDLPWRTQALQMAVAEARAKAEALATALNMRLEAINEVIEGGVSIIPPPQPMGDMMLRTAETVATPVQPGEMRVQASVSIRYRIAPKPLIPR